MPRNEGKLDTSDDAVAAGSITPGVPSGARIMDPPPAIGPRDALVDPREGDIIPDLQEKGYHAGHVAQPALPVTVDGVTVVGFTSSEPSRFTSFRELKSRPDPADLGVPAGPDPAPAVRLLPGVGMVDTSAIHGGGPRVEAER